MKRVFTIIIIILLLASNGNASFEALAFMLGKNYALKITGEYISPYASKAISFALDPTSTVIGEGMEALSTVSPDTVKALQIAMNPQGAAEQAVLQESLKIISSQDPQAAVVLSRSIELSNYAKVAFSGNEESNNNIADIKTDKGGNTIVERNGVVFAEIPKNWEVKKEGDSLIFTSNGGGTLKVGDYSLDKTNKNDKIIYEENEKEKTSKLKIQGNADLTIGADKFDNVKDGEFQTERGDVIFAKFGATADSHYSFYNGLIRVDAKKGSNVFYDNKNEVFSATDSKITDPDLSTIEGKKIDLKLNNKNYVVDSIYVEGGGKIIDSNGEIVFDKSLEIHHIPNKCVESKVSCIESIGLYRKVKATEDIHLTMTYPKSRFKSQIRVLTITDDSKVTIIDDATKVFISKDPVRLEGKLSKINSIIGIDYKDSTGKDCSEYIGSSSIICTNKNNVYENLKEFVFKHTESTANGEIGKFYGAGSRYEDYWKNGIAFGLTKEQATYFAYLKDVQFGSGSNKEILAKVKDDMINKGYKPGDVTSDGIKIPDEIIRTDCITFCKINAETMSGDENIDETIDRALEASLKHPSTKKVLGSLEGGYKKDIEEINTQIQDLKEKGILDEKALQGFEDQKKRITSVYNTNVEFSKGLMGTELFKKMEEDGWKTVYYNPDVNNPSDKSVEHIQTAKLVKSQGTYYGIPVTTQLLNYRPTTQFEDKKIPSKITKKDESIMKIINCMPFGAVIGRGGQHSATLSCGNAIDAHIHNGPRDIGLFTMRNFESQWEWLSGAMVFPPGDWEKYSKNPSSSNCPGCKG